MATPLSPSGRIGESGSSTRLEDRSGPEGGDPAGSYDSEEFTSGSDSSYSSSDGSEDDDYYDSEANLNSTRFESKKGYDSRIAVAGRFWIVWKRYGSAQIVRKPLL